MRIEQRMKRISKTSRRHRGFALALVLAVIGLAVVMSASILATATVQAQLKSNAAAAAEAQYLAESATNLAIYYLQHPEKAPSLSGEVYPGQSGITFGSTVSGTADVTVSNVSGNTYDIFAVGHAGGTGASAISRDLKVRVQVVSEYQITDAADFNGSFTVPDLMSITGKVRCDGVLTKSLAATVSGSIFAAGSNIGGWTAIPTFPTAAVPTKGQITLFTTLSDAVPHYSYVDSSGTHTGTAQLLGATVSGTLTGNVSNPMNVWYTDDDVTLGNCTVNGTIVLRGAGKKLIVDGAAHITASSGMPAVLVSSSIQFESDLTTKSLTVDGLCWTGGNITTSSGAALNCSMQVNGALMMSSASPQVSTNIVGIVAVNYDSTKVQIPTFASVNCTPKSVKILQWGF
jgi:hypothetical protein